MSTQTPPAPSVAQQLAQLQRELDAELAAIRQRYHAKMTALRAEIVRGILARQAA